jgi:Zn-dependent protease
MINNWGNLGFLDLVFLFMSYALVILVALPVHEYAHAYTAYRMGDNTARWNGRLTMNPFAHLDIIGTILIFVFGFGYAKPVPINPRNFRNYKTGMLLTSLAGPMSNLIMGFLTLSVIRVLFVVAPQTQAFALIIILLRTFAQINVMLAVFNLLPIPPLDGYRIASNFLPAKWVYYIERYQWYITMGLFLLIATGMLGNVIGAIYSPVYSLFLRILGF